MHTAVVSGDHGRPDIALGVPIIHHITPYKLQSRFRISQSTPPPTHKTTEPSCAYLVARKHRKPHRWIGNWERRRTHPTSRRRIPSGHRGIHNAPPIGVGYSVHRGQRGPLRWVGCRPSKEIGNRPWVSIAFDREPWISTWPGVFLLRCSWRFFRVWLGLGAVAGLVGLLVISSQSQSCLVSMLRFWDGGTGLRYLDGTEVPEDRKRETE